MSCAKSQIPVCELMQGEVEGRSGTLATQGDKFNEYNNQKNITYAGELKPLVNDLASLPFGGNFTDHMFTMEYDTKNGWHNAEIKPYQPLVLDPAAAVFHYGQEVFEGQKAYKSNDGRILMFRPLENARRCNKSLDRMCMPQIPEDIYLAAECELLKIEERWIPKSRDAAIYIRPFVIATEPFLGVRPGGTLFILHYPFFVRSLF